jgi:hypothetical protein
MRPRYAPTFPYDCHILQYKGVFNLNTLGIGQSVKYLCLFYFGSSCKILNFKLANFSNELIMELTKLLG